MKALTSIALMIGLALPIWKAYTLNTTVDHLRNGPRAVPFFAYYRYGFLNDSVVFNISSRSCASVVEDVVPTFRRFIATLEEENPREIRLAWHGETLAVVQRSAIETVWHETAWTDAHALESLGDTIQCTTEDDLFFDWRILVAPATAMI